MRKLHNKIMVDRIRIFLIILEEGSLNRAASRLGVTQSTLTRQLQSLEAEIGAPLVERGNLGIRPTDLGFLVRDRLEPIVEEFESTWKEIQAAGIGHTNRLRVGYLGLSAARYLNPVLGDLRKAFPDLNLDLMDMTPGEQMSALADGKLDIAMAGQEANLVSDQYHTRTIVRLPLIAAVPVGHPLSEVLEAPLSDFKNVCFVGAPEKEVPGRNAWITKLCKKAGFKARFTKDATSLGESFSIAVGESAVSLFPDYIEGNPPPGVVYVRITDPWIRWDYLVLRPPGKGSKTVKAFMKLITDVVV